MEVENSENAIRALKYIKNDLLLNPEIIVHDLSPNLIKATCDVFGYDKMAFDPFHVMQALNRAISKDLKSFRAINFSFEKNELIKLRDYISSLQSEFKNYGKFRDETLKKLPKIASNHSKSGKCKSFAEDVLKLCRIQEKKQFKFKLGVFLSDIHKESDETRLRFAQSIEKYVPKRVLTEKGHKRLILELLKKLKSHFILSRKPIEQNQKDFSKTRNILFFQPEKLTEERSKLLISFLKKYPELAIYRELTLRIGSIYRLPLDKVLDSLITTIKIREEYGPDLKTCLNTFKQHYRAIFRFRDFFITNPEMPRRSRANMEFNNRPVKKIFGSGLNCKSIGRIENELKLHLGGDVRNFIKVV